MSFSGTPSMITDKSAEHALVLFLLFCGLMLIRIFLVPQFRQRYLAVFHIDECIFTREIISLAVLTTITMLVMPTIDLTTRLLDFADFAFTAWVAYAGFAVGALAVALLWRIQYDWLKFFDGEHEARRSFIRNGVYRFIRHPFYAVLLLLAVAQTLLLQNWIGGPAAIFTFLIVYLARIPIDDQRAMEFYGHSYLDYMDRTNSLLPRLFAEHDD
jgi:protein-S-isoprenylcysteine O-methyltransferase Ste14